MSETRTAKAPHFLDLPRSIPNCSETEVNAWYEGTCPITGELLRLPRTPVVEALCRHLAGELESWELDEGKMFGVLLVRHAQGEVGYAKAFSGLLNGESTMPGWVPPLHVRQITRLESETLLILEEKKMRLQDIARELDQHRFPSEAQSWSALEVALKIRHDENRQRRRHGRRVDPQAGAHWESLSRKDSLERRDFRRSKKQALGHLREDFERLRAASATVRAERRAHSRILQHQMHQQFSASASTDLGCSVEALFPNGIPTGTGDCCAPKLLSWAIRHHLKPLAMAEFWWGPTSVGQRIPGEFYSACQIRCQPLIGPLLRKASSPFLDILYEDDEVIALEKPSGLLTTPGRHSWNQDSLLLRLRQERKMVLPVHRLDFETSGLVLFAKTSEAQAHLRRQFEDRSLGKIYQALLEDLPETPLGRVEAALLRSPTQRPTYRMDPRGKSAATEYRILEPGTHRIELKPLSGRSHQLRVHMAKSLGCPIQGDRLYGTQPHGTPGRLALHAHRLEFIHPRLGAHRVLESQVPF